MEVTTFSCKHCGASVDVPGSPGVVSCTYCGSKHRVSFSEGSVNAELTARVKRLDEDVARLKAGPPPPQRHLGLGDRLARIEEGKRKWHAYVATVKTGKSGKSPDLVALYTAARADLVAGYGSGNGELVNDYCDPNCLDYDPTAGYSCLFILIGLIILVGMLGAIKISVDKIVPGIVLLAVALVAAGAGVPFVVNMVRADRRVIAKRKEALRQLDEIEREMRRKLADEKTA